VADIGNKLKQAREALGISLVEAEHETRIRRAFLQALEEERFADLPGDVYTRGFLRNYAMFLNLDPQSILDEFDQLRTGYVRQNSPDVLDEPLLPEKPVNLGALIFLAVVGLLVAALAGWYIYGEVTGSGGPGDAVRRLIHGSGTPRVQASAIPHATLTADPTNAPASTQTAPAKSTAQPANTVTQQPADSATAAPTAEPAATTAPAPTAIPADGIEVVVDVLEETWFYVLADQGVIFDGVLQAGDRKVWNADSVIYISMGNGGAVTLTVNGVEVGMPGASGEITEINYTIDTLPGGQ